MARPDSIIVAAAQYPIARLADFAAIEAKLERWIADAGEEGASLVVFPEYGAMEFAGTFDDRSAGDLDLSLAAVADAMPRIDEIHVRLARRHAIHILAASGPCRRPGGRYVNAARLFTPGGGIGVAEKIIMTPFERDWGITGGGGLRVFDTTLGRIGVLVCYDSEFPLLGRALVEAGTDVVLVPSCTERPSGANRIRTAARARALEGTVATITAPTVGLAPWSPAVDRNCGTAGVYVPAEAGVSETGILAEGETDTASLVIGRIDLAALRRLRTSGEMRNVADWQLQPGAGSLPVADLIDLR